MRHALSRIGVAIVTLIFVLVFNFFLFRAAGDPKKDLIRSRLTPAARAKLIHERGLDQSVGTQFVRYVENTLQGELETSFQTNRAVSKMIKDALPNTLILVGISTLLATVIGSWLGVVAAARRGRPMDTLITQTSLALYSMPEFWLGMILIAILSVKYGLFPTGQKTDPGASLHGGSYWWNVAEHATLPILTLTLGLLGQYVVMMRSALSDVLNEDYVTTAKAVGNPRSRVLGRHAVRNALLPVVTLAALNLGFVVSGALTIETLFSWPGLGKLTYDAISNKDFPVLQGVFLVASAAVIVVNLLTDFMYQYLDPRVRT